MSSERLMEIGRVARPHGVHGALRVLGGETVPALHRLFLAHDGAAPVEYRVRNARASAGGLLLELVGIEDRDAAAALRGAMVLARRDELPPPTDEEVYVADLVGCELVDASGARLGHVTGTYPSGAQELLVVRRPSGDEALVPFVHPIVIAVDLEQRRLVCDPPEGLFES